MNRLTAKHAKFSRKVYKVNCEILSPHPLAPWPNGMNLLVVGLFNNQFTFRIRRRPRQWTKLAYGWCFQQPISKICSKFGYTKKFHLNDSFLADTMGDLQLRTVNVIRYVTPLREGGSMPAIAEADDGFLYVLKFRGAGQGPRALISELIGGEIARILGLKMPELVFANLDEAFGRTEPDEEIQDLLKASVGLNLALHYLSGAISFDPTVTQVDPTLASQIVWLDALLTNMDRTCRNTNMLLWHKELWLIDHGASLYFHHSWQDWEEQAKKPFVLIKDHVLLPWASELAAVDEAFKIKLTNEHIRAIVALIPDEWLEDESIFNTKDEHREAYAQFLESRLAHSAIFLKEAQHARTSLI